MTDTITQWSELFITDKGLALRQKAIALGLRPEFVYAEIGEGVPSNPSQIPTMTSLVQYAEKAAVMRSASTGATHILDVRIDNQNFTTSVIMREMAIYAKLLPPDETDEDLIELPTDDPELNELWLPILYGYAYTIQGYEAIPAGIDFHRIWTVGCNTELSRSMNISITYDGSSVYATLEDLDVISQKVQDAYDNMGYPATETQAGFMTPEMYIKLAGIEPGATNYIHPSTHPASMIIESTARRFVSDDWLSQVNGVIDSPEGITLASLAEDIAYIQWQLILNGLLDSDGVENVIVDTIDSIDSVDLVSGMYANGRIYI